MLEVTRNSLHITRFSYRIKTFFWNIGLGHFIGNVNKQRAHTTLEVSNNRFRVTRFSYRAVPPLETHGKQRFETKSSIAKIRGNHLGKDVIEEEEVLCWKQLQLLQFIKAPELDRLLVVERAKLIARESSYWSKFLFIIIEEMIYRWGGKKGRKSSCV